jgi:hypothetical protein
MDQERGDDTPPRRRPTERERDYFRRLGEWEATNERISLEEHLRLSLLDRLRRSERITRNHGRFLRPGEEQESAAFFRRARELGKIIR